MNVYGIRQDYKGAYVSVIMKMLDAIDQRQPLTIYGDGSATYDFISVEDCAKANIMAADARVSSEFVNVGTGIGTSLNELTQLLFDLCEIRGVVRYREQENQTFVSHRVGDTCKALRDIGFSSSVQLCQGLAKLVRWRKADQILF